MDMCFFGIKSFEGIFQLSSSDWHVEDVGFIYHW